MESAFANSAPTPHTHWRRARLTVAGVEIAAFELGSLAGPTIVLIHGLGHWTDAAWGRLAPLLAEDYRIVAFDLPGFGESDRPDAPYDLPFFRRIATGVLDARAPQPIAIVGHSLGGMIAADLAATMPERIDRLALIDPAGFLRAPRLFVKLVASPLASGLFSIRPSRRFVKRTLDQSVFDPTANDAALHARAYELASDPGVRRAFARVYSGAMQELLDVQALHARFARFEKPTQIIWGRDDRFVPIKGVEQARRTYPHADVRILARAGHCPMIEHPQQVARVLLSFLESPA